MKKKTKNIVLESAVSAGGWKILPVLWNRGPCSASQIETSLEETTGWTCGNIRSYLDRLVKHGAVRKLVDEKIDRFEAACDRDTLFLHEINELLEKCDADFIDLFAVYLANKRITAETAKMLKSLISKHELKK